MELFLPSRDERTSYNYVAHKTETCVLGDLAKPKPKPAGERVHDYQIAYKSVTFHD